MTDQELIRSLTTIGAVILGFLLGQISDWIKSIKTSHRQKVSLKKLLNLEIEHNISQVKLYWDKVIKSEESWHDEDGHFKFVHLAEAAGNNPLPLLSSDAWKNNLDAVASIYCADELEKLWHFQKNLENIFSLHFFFSEAINEKKETSRFHDSEHGVGIGTIISGVGFADTVKKYAPEFKETIEKILKFKNNA